MSFYGHILYEFTKLFSKFNFTNQDEDVATLQADDAWEQLNLNTGDRWLKFSVSGEEPNERTVNLTHEAPAEAIDQKFTYFKHLTEVPAEPEQLHGGDYVAINTETTHDEKGHLNSKQTIGSYRLPKVVMTINEPSADSNNDELQFTGDYWTNIEIVDNDGEKILFSHTEPNSSEEEEKTVYNFKVNNNEPTTAELHCGDPVHLLTETQYDSKGHLINLNSATYTLPTIGVQINGNAQPASKDTLWLKGDTWINLTGDAHDEELTFSHTGPKTDGAVDCSGLSLICEGATAENNETIIKEGMPDESQKKYDELKPPSVHILQPGELLKIHSITKDEKGHIASNSEAYIRLPISADTAMFDSYVNRINILEGRLGEKDTEGSYEKNVETLSNLNTQSEDFASITDLTGSLEETMYTVKEEEEDKYKNLKTITATIGQIDGDKGYSQQIARLLGDADDRVYTLSEALRRLTEKLIDMSATVSNLNKNIDDLYRKNSELEEQIKKLQPTTE